MRKKSKPIFWMPWHKDGNAAYTCVSGTRKGGIENLLAYFPAGTKWRKLYRDGWRLVHVKLVRI